MKSLLIAAMIAIGGVATVGVPARRQASSFRRTMAGTTAVVIMRIAVTGGDTMNVIAGYRSAAPGITVIG